jgi:hypothetical protein
MYNLMVAMPPKEAIFKFGEEEGAHWVFNNLGVGALDHARTGLW